LTSFKIYIKKNTTLYHAIIPIFICKTYSIFGVLFYKKWLKITIFKIQRTLVRPYVSSNFLGLWVRRKDGYLQWIAMISARAFFFIVVNTHFSIVFTIFLRKFRYYSTIMTVLTMLSTHRRQLCWKIGTHQPCKELLTFSLQLFS